jgi:hypothetical protein
MLAAFLAGLMAGAPASANAAHDLSVEQQLLAGIGTLASDEFAGREPGTDGEKKTLRYLARQWFDIGLVSGTNDPRIHGSRPSRWSGANRWGRGRSFHAKAVRSPCPLLTCG